MDAAAVDVRPIRQEDALAVGQFLHEHLNQAVPIAAWMKVIDPPWKADAPNHGFQLVSGGQVVGAHLAVYSERSGADGPVPICNLAAFCVLEEFRMHGLRLLRPLLAQKSFDFVDLSPSGNVVGLNERLGFRRLDTSTRLIPNLPFITRRGIRVTGESASLERILQGRDAQAFRDHRHAPAARHVLVEQDSAYAYVIFRRDRRKGLPLFASPLYVGGDRTVLERHWPSVASYILFDHHLPATLAERRILGFAPRLGVDLASPRPKMIRGKRLDAAALDYLYSELALVEW